MNLQVDVVVVANSRVFHLASCHHSLGDLDLKLSIKVDFSKEMWNLIRETLSKFNSDHRHNKWVTSEEAEIDQPPPNLT